jgi:hypothetical protein
MKIIINQRQANEKIFDIFENETGSEKQINWSNQIKLNKISDLLNMLGKPENEEKIISVFNKMNEIKDSKFWIDNRNIFTKNIAKEIENNKSNGGTK